MVKTCAALNCNSRFEKRGNLSFHQFPTNPELRMKWIAATKRPNFNPSKYTYLCSKHFNDSCFNSNRLGGLIVLNKDVVPTIFEYDASDKKSVLPKHAVNESTIEVIDSTEPSISYPQYHVLIKEEIIEDPLSTNSNFSSPVSPHNNYYKLVNEQQEISSSSSISLVYEKVNNSMEELQSSSTDTASETEENLLETSSIEKKKSRYGHPRYFGDCAIDEMESPRIARRNWEIAKRTIAKQKQQIKILQQSKRRLHNRILKLKGLVKELKKNRNVSA